MPSELVAALELVHIMFLPDPPPIVQNNLSSGDHVTDDHKSDFGKVRDVHVVPSGLVAAIVVLSLP
jgi:hypothetical protein